MLLCVPTFAQYANSVDYNLSAEYKKYNNIKKAGVAGIVVFGTKAKRIKNSSGETVALLGWDVNQQGLSLSLTF